MNFGEGVDALSYKIDQGVSTVTKGGNLGFECTEVVGISVYCLNNK